MAYTEGTCHVRGASRRCDEAPCRNAKHAIMYLCCDLGTGFGAGLEAREDFSDLISGFINSRRMLIKWESAGMHAEVSPGMSVMPKHVGSRYLQHAKVGEPKTSQLPKSISKTVPWGFSGSIYRLCTSKSVKREAQTAPKCNNSK